MKTLDELEISTLTYNYFRRAGINTIAVAKVICETDIPHVKGIPDRCVEEMRRAIKEHEAKQ